MRRRCDLISYISVARRDSIKMMGEGIPGIASVLGMR